MILNPVILQRISDKKKRLDSLRPLSPSLVSRLRNQVIIEWTYNSNAIEGTRLSLKETELVIEQGLTVRGVPMRDHFEALNHKEAILYLEELVRKGNFRIDCLLIGQIHQLILKNIDQENAGKYRQVQIKITGSNHSPPLPIKIPLKMKAFEEWLRERKNRKYLIDYAAIAHFKLVDIHPFIDGNGRTSRLLMNLILMSAGYPPTIILKTDRPKYYQALTLAHKGNIKPFVDFIGQCVDRSLTWYLDAVLPENKKEIKEKWRLLSQLAPDTQFSQEYLSLLARKGKIEAVKRGRNWYSNLRSIDNYLEEIKEAK